MMNQFTQLDVILPFIFNLFAIIFEIWFLISLIHYGIKNRKWKRLQFGNPDILNSGAIYGTVVACGICCIVHSAVAAFYIALGFNLGEDDLCDSLGDGARSTYVLMLLTTYLFLWLRQRAFYMNRMLNVNYSTKVRVFSTVSIVIIFLSIISVLVLNVYPEDHMSSLNGCIFMPDPNLRVGNLISVVIVIAVGQTALLGLLIYALTQTRNKNGTSCTELMYQLCCCKKSDQNNPQPTQNKSRVFSIYSSQSSSTYSTTTTIMQATSASRKLNRKAETIRKVMYKTIAFAVISILSPLMIQLFDHFVVVPGGHQRFAILVRSLNAILNLLLLVFSFTEYCKMLFSPCAQFCT